PAIPPGGLERVRPAAHDDRRARGRAAVDDGAGPGRGPRGIAPRHGENPGESEVDAREALEPPSAGERLRPLAERLDQLVRALVTLAALADAAIDDLLQRSAAVETLDLGQPDARPRVTLDQHAQELSHLIHIVARLPLGRRAGEDVTRRHVGVERACRDAAAIVLLPDDAEVAELEAMALADEDVERREVAVEQLPAVELAEHLQ